MSSRSVIIQRVYHRNTTEMNLSWLFSAMQWWQMLLQWFLATSSSVASAGLQSARSIAASAGSLIIYFPALQLDCEYAFYTFQLFLVSFVFAPSNLKPIPSWSEQNFISTFSRLLLLQAFGSNNWAGTWKLIRFWREVGVTCKWKPTYDIPAQYTPACDQHADVPAQMFSVVNHFILFTDSWCRNSGFILKWSHFLHCKLLNSHI